MPFVKGKSGNPLGLGSVKPFADALRMEIAAAGKDHKALRKIAKNLLKLAEQEDFDALPAINAVANRLDGMPAQESTVTIEKRDAFDWTRGELVTLIDDATEGGARVAAPNGRGGKSDQVH